MSSQLASDGLINQAREVRAALGAMERKVAAMEALQEALLGNALPDNGGVTGSKVTGSKVMGSLWGQRSRGCRVKGSRCCWRSLWRLYRVMGPKVMGSRGQRSTGTR